MTARIVAYINQKGGVGKTTTLYHHARSFVRRGLRTLAVDLDPQGNLTSVITREAFEADQVGIADVLSTRAAETLRDVIVPGVWDNLDVVPSNGAPLAGVQRELVASTAGREHRLRSALSDVVGEYDVILIDCGPSMDLLTTNALVAASTVVIVTEATLFSVNGLSQVLGSVQEIRTYYNPTLTLAGVVLNRYDRQTIAGDMWRRDLVLGIEAHGVELLHPIIPKRTVIQNALEAAMGLDEYKSPRTAEMYDTHTQQIVPEGATS